MARFRSRRPRPRREWLTPARYTESDLGQTGSLADFNISAGHLGSEVVGDQGTKVHANTLVSVQAAMDPGDPPGSMICYHPLGPYTIERIVGTCHGWTNDQDANPQPVCSVLYGVLDVGNPYLATGTTPAWDNIRVTDGVMHQCGWTMTAANSGPSAITQHIDVRTKRIVTPDKSFYIIDRVLTTIGGGEEAFFQHNIKCLVRYAS